MTNQICCPVCGSEKIEKTVFINRERIYLSDIEYNRVEHICKNCGERGDFTHENDERFLEAADKAKRISLEIILSDLGDKGISMAYIERALELSQRTLSRWKSKGISASGMALMRMVYLFPWLLKVADNDYEKNYALRELITQAGSSLVDTLNLLGVSTTAATQFSPENKELIFHVKMGKGGMDRGIEPSTDEVHPSVNVTGIGKTETSTAA